MKRYSITSVIISISAFIIVLFTGSALGQQKENVNAGDLVKNFADAWTQHNPDAIDDLFTKDGIYEDIAAGESWQGTDKIKNLMKSTLEAIPNFNVKINQWFSDKDKVSCEWIMTGTQSGNFPNIPETGKSFSVRGSSVILLENGKIKHWTDYYDMYTFLHQLDAIPEPVTKEDAEVEKNKSMIQEYIDEMNKRNENFLNDYFAANYVYHGQNGDLDSEGFKKMHHMFLTAFPNAVMKAEDIIAAGDKVITRWKFHGTQKGMFMGIKPTGKEVTIKGIIISQFKNGKVVEEWEEANGVSLMQQLGILPSPKN